LANPYQRLRVPASSANLGPGFDSLGLALSPYLTCRFRRSEELQIRAYGRDAELISTGADNMIWQTALSVAERERQTLPPVELEVHNDIPLGKGLGSSAAALTAGVVIANQLLGLNWKKLRILDEAARIEGHPDNVAACVLGSIVASAIDSNGLTRAVRLDLPTSFGTAIVVPDFPLPTSEARAVLPTSYSRADAVFNVQRSALLIAALATGNVTAFPAALEDRMHQPYREPLVPGLKEILKLRAPGLLGCALSGAGPSVIVFFEKGYEFSAQHVRQIFNRHGHEAEILAALIDRDGYKLEEESE
jgi:homoserine kinase